MIGLFELLPGDFVYGGSRLKPEGINDLCPTG
jgi:hypothetical protein